MGKGLSEKHAEAHQAALLAARHLFEGAARAASRNRRQKIAFVLLTLVIAVGGAFFARVFIKPTDLVFAVGPEGSLDNGFARRLAPLAEYSRRIRVVPSPQESAAAAQSLFAQRKADLLIARADAKIVARHRAIALVEHSTLLVAVPKNAKAKTLAALKGKRLAIIGGDPRDAALVRQVLVNYDFPANQALEERSIEDWPRLFEPNGPAAVFYLARKSEIATDKFWPNRAQKPNFELIEIDGAKALEARIRGLKAETVEAGLLVPSPKIPAEDVETLGVDEFLMSRARLTSANAASLATIVIENRDQLADPGHFAASIEPPDTDKDAIVLAHPGAAEYVNDETKTFIDRYSDLIYLGMSLASIVGTIFLGLYSTVTRVSPVRAGQLTDSVLAIGERATAAAALPDLAQLEKELNEILSMVLGGMRDGTIAHDGFEAFRLVFDVAREAIATQKNIIASRDLADAAHLQA